MSRRPIITKLEKYRNGVIDKFFLLVTTAWVNMTNIYLRGGIFVDLSSFPFGVSPCCLCNFCVVVGLFLE